MRLFSAKALTGITLVVGLTCFVLGGFLVGTLAHLEGWQAGEDHGRALQRHQDATQATRIAKTAKDLGFVVGRRSVFREIQDRMSSAMVEHLTHARTFSENAAEDPNAPSMASRELGKVDCEREEMVWAYDQLEITPPADALVCQ